MMQATWPSYTPSGTYVRKELLRLDTATGRTWLMLDEGWREIASSTNIGFDPWER